MNASSTGADIGEASSESSLCAWFGFWAQFVVLALLVVLGAFFAGADDAPGDSTCGLILSLAAVALAFLRLKNSFDGGPSRWSGFLLVGDMPNLVAMIVVFVIVGLVGLFIAAGLDFGGMHNGGVALFVASGLGVFLSLKNVFDRLERRG